MKKIEEAQEILKDLGLPIQQQNKISALTLLALAGIKENDDWSSATNESVTLSKDIIEFCNSEYSQEYKPNTRESFRKNALKPFVEFNLATLNRDNPSLLPSSSKTHYALSDIALNAISKFHKPSWESAVLEFRKLQYPENSPSTIILNQIKISNYKSILEDTIELGRFNIFIGTNGCGKTNILEAIAMIGSEKSNDLNFEGLYSRGVRNARPNLFTSSFLNKANKDSIDIELDFHDGNTKHVIKSSLKPDNEKDIYTKWSDTQTSSLLENSNIKIMLDAVISDIVNQKDYDFTNDPRFIEIKKEFIEKGIILDNEKVLPLLTEFVIYDVNTKSLRGITVDSRKTPLGLNGEGLDLLISNFNNYERTYLNRCKVFFDWLDDIVSDKDDKLKLEGLKPGRSVSTLYFKDKYMQKQNNVLSAENSNEGILHVLFYISLFISNKTPNLFAIDNIETALNPRLCQLIIKELAKLSKERGKQVMITTHNPAILDGLNLFDDEQRLFEVYRNDEGNTVTRRIKFRSDLSDKKYKLSEMWLKGLLGAVPQNF